MNKSEQVIQLAEQGMRRVDIAKEVDLSLSRVQQILARRTQDIEHLAPAEPVEEPAGPLSNEEILDKVWSLTEQEREQIHYGVIEMGNPPGEVGACFGVGPEVVLKVIELASIRDMV